MPSVFLYADPHFGHKGVCHFTREDGSKLRPWDTPEEMDEALVSSYNKMVKPADKVYFLGDVVINKRALVTLGRLHGDKVLVKGNHDIFKDEDYAPYFKSIRAYHVMSGLILSHIPVHEASLGRFGCNIHGHLHSGRVRKPRGVIEDRVVYGPEIDPRYWCASVENLPNFAPILFENALKLIREQGGLTTFRN